MAKQLRTQDLVASIEFILNGMSTDKLIQLLDDISSTQKVMDEDGNHNCQTENLKSGLNFVRVLINATIESRIVPNNE